MTLNKVVKFIHGKTSLIKLFFTLSLTINTFSLFSQNSPTKIDSTEEDLPFTETYSQLDETIQYIDDSEFFVYFSGGKDSKSSNKHLNKFLKQNLIYPDSAVKDRIEGKVYVSFTIDSVGHVANIKIEKGSNKYFDDEVMRVMSIMPNWEWDKNVKVILRRKLVKKVIPISFSFEKDKRHRLFSFRPK